MAMSRIRATLEFASGKFLLWTLIVQSIVPIKYLKHLLSLDDTSIINVNRKMLSTLQLNDVINVILMLY